MIQQDQPANLPDSLIVAVSSRQDRTMLNRELSNRHDEDIVADRRSFCAAAGIDYKNCVYQLITYGTEQTYDTITEVTEPNNDGLRADTLYTEQKNVAPFLPVADCVATVIYDPARKALALAHLGRHSTLVNMMTKTIAFFVEKGSNPQDLLVWMAPSAKQANYRMEYFDAATRPEWQDFCEKKTGGYYLDLSGYNRARAIEQGVLPANIVVSAVDTATDPHYFSHSQGDREGRFAVVAMIRD